MKNTAGELHALERLSGGDSVIHRLHPTGKLLATVVFIVTAVSFDRYAFGRLIPYFFYPTVLMALSETPYALLLKRFLIALPFCLFAGVSNVLFDRAAAFVIGGAAISYGVISLFTILLRAYLCVMAVLILVAVTPFAEITAALRRLRVPAVFAVVFEMTYRYINVLLEEAYAMYTAYTLRGGGAKGIHIRDMGGFVGQLLLRAFDRAERVYAAMQCRGYDPAGPPSAGVNPSRRDVVFVALICLWCAVFRFIDLSALGGRA